MTAEWLKLGTGHSDLEVRHALDVLVQREFVTYKSNKADAVPVVLLTAAGRDNLMHHRKQKDGSTG